MAVKMYLVGLMCGSDEDLASVNNHVHLEGEKGLWGQVMQP